MASVRLNRGTKADPDQDDVWAVAEFGGVVAAGAEA
jgi:hypothetical protein